MCVAYMKIQPSIATQGHVSGVFLFWTICVGTNVTCIMTLLWNVSELSGIYVIVLEKGAWLLKTCFCVALRRVLNLLFHRKVYPVINVHVLRFLEIISDWIKSLLTLVERRFRKLSIYIWIWCYQFMVSLNTIYCICWR